MGVPRSREQRADQLFLLPAGPSRLLNSSLLGTLVPTQGHGVERGLKEGDLVGGAEVLEVPGPFPGRWRSGGPPTQCWSAVTA